MNPVGRSFRSGPNLSVYSPQSQQTTHSPHYTSPSSPGPYEPREELAHSYSNQQPKYVQSFLSESLTSPPLHSSQQRYPSPEFASRHHSRSVSPHRPRSSSRDDTYNGYDHYSSPKLNAMVLADEAPPTESLYNLASSPSHSRQGSSSPLGHEHGSPMSVSSRGHSSFSLPDQIASPSAFGMMTSFPSTPSPLSYYVPQAKQTGLTAVNVFGFPPPAAPQVLQLFQQVGHLVHYNYAEGKNFMTLSFSSRISAEKALQKNGKQVQIGDTPVMLGVVLVEPEVDHVEKCKREFTPIKRHDDYSTPTKIPTPLTSPMARPAVLTGASKRESIAYSQPYIHREPEPVQPYSLLLKISEFLFGW